MSMRRNTIIKLLALFLGLSLIYVTAIILEHRPSPTSEYNLPEPNIIISHAVSRDVRYYIVILLVEPIRRLDPRLKYPVTVRQDESFYVTLDLKHVFPPKEFADEKEKQEEMRRGVYVSLNVAGMEVTPAGETWAWINRRMIWSLRAKESGEYKGLVRFREPSHSSNKPVRGLETKELQFSVLVTKPVDAYLIVIGIVNVLGWLLATLPAWLTWWEKRKQSRLRADEDFD